MTKHKMGGFKELTIKRPGNQICSFASGIWERHQSWSSAGYGERGERIQSTKG